MIQAILIIVILISLLFFGPHAQGASVHMGQGAHRVMAISGVPSFLLLHREATVLDVGKKLLP